VGEKITRLNAPRAYCVALASAVTVLLATALGLPVSSTHIAIGAIFGIGFLREYVENPNKKRIKPSHRLNHTAEDAFNNTNHRQKRKLVRRRFVVSIAAAWVITCARFRQPRGGYILYSTDFNTDGEIASNCLIRALKSSRSVT
jgi:PiT family inorganic phosphate transporter